MKTDNNVLKRYSRQILFKNIGKEGQEKLANKCVAIAGCGALGSVSVNSLVRGGIGKLKIIDRDFVEESNLQRQIIFDENDVQNDIPKAIAAKDKLQKINSNVEIEAYVSDINYSNVADLLKDCNIVIDGLDNFETRYLLNDYCVKNNIPWVYGACVGSIGLSMNVIPGKTPCLRCIFETMPSPGNTQTCETEGIIAPIANIIGSIQVVEAFKILTENFEAINKNLIRIDVWNGKYDKIGIESIRNISNCPVCKEGKFEFLFGHSTPLTTTLCGRNAVQIKYKDSKKINFASIAGRLTKIGEVRYNEFMLKFKIDSYELTLFNDGRAIILGTNDSVKAKNLYSKYIGM